MLRCCGCWIATGSASSAQMGKGGQPGQSGCLWMPRGVRGRGSSRRRGLVGGTSGHAGGPDPPCPDPPITPPKGCLNQVASWEFRNGVVSPNPMMEQSVQNVGGLATALLKRVEEQQPNLRCSSLPMTSAATERNSKVISSDPPIMFSAGLTQVVSGRQKTLQRILPRAIGRR
jgi:hypothetical protein